MASRLTSRQRVYGAIRSREVDRVPIDIGGTKATGTHVDAYIETGRYLGIDVGMPKVYDQFQLLARFGQETRSRLCADAIELENLTETWNLKNSNWRAWKTGKGNDALMPGDFDPVADEREGIRSSVIERGIRSQTCLPGARISRGRAAPP